MNIPRIKIFNTLTSVIHTPKLPKFFSAVERDYFENLKSIRITPTYNRNDKYTYIGIFVNNIGVDTPKCLKFLDKAYVFLIGITMNSKNLRLIRNSEGQILGGYSRKILSRGKEFYIATMTVDKKNPQCFGKKRPKMIGMIYDNIVNEINNQKKVQYITLAVDHKAKELIKLYEKFGFKIYEKDRPCNFTFDPGYYCYKMKVSKEEFMNARKRIKNL